MYYWQGYAPKGIDANDAAKELDRISLARGSLTPGAVVDESRPESAVLHTAFEWNDAAAAEEWRKQQARQVIKAVVVRYDGPSKQNESVRAFVHVRDEEGQPEYMETSKAMANELTREQVLRRAKSELDSWRDRYRHLKEFAGVVSAIEATKAA